MNTKQTTETEAFHQQQIEEYQSKIDQITEEEQNVLFSEMF